MFEGLLEDPSHNRRLMKLLYRTAEWHALAKLRMHTDTTLDMLDLLTVEFGKLMREFRDITCAEFDTVELPREVAARNRRQAASLSTSSVPPNLPPQPSKKKKALNLFTIKFHFLGDYAHHIRQYGTTDSYSTQLVSHDLFEQRKVLIIISFRV